MRNLRFLTLISSLIISMLFLASCSDDSDPVSGETPKTSIRVIHASYDAPAVDILINNAASGIAGLAYTETSGYAEIDAGTYNIKVVAAGTTSPAVIDADLTFAENESYTILAVGSLADGSITAILDTDDRTPSSTQAKVRAIHASPDAPAVDIKLNDGAGAAVFAGAPFKGITDYVAVDAADYSFAITPAGATAEVRLYDPIAVAAGNVYTVVAHGTLDETDNSPFSVRVFVDNGDGNVAVDLVNSTSNVLVVHGSPDAPGVDLLVDANVVNGAALTFPNNTGYLPVNAGDRNFKVNVSGTPTTVIDVTPNLDRSANYTVFAANFVSSIEPVLLADDLTAPAAGNAHVRFVHLSPDAPNVDITLTDGTVVFGDRAFKTSTDFTPLAAGTFDLQARVAGTSTVALNLPGIVLDEGKIYTVFANGALADLSAAIIVNN
ncbi:MAG: DUF4397 domain-containing protein [Calditrichia bacterium]